MKNNKRGKFSYTETVSQFIKQDGNIRYYLAVSTDMYKDYLSAFIIKINLTDESKDTIIYLVDDNQTIH